jgi:hypothetical protein
MLMQELKKSLSLVNADIEHMEESDHACSKEYELLLGTRRLIQRAIKRMERLEALGKKVSA